MKFSVFAILLVLAILVPILVVEFTYVPPPPPSAPAPDPGPESTDRDPVRPVGPVTPPEVVEVTRERPIEIRGTLRSVSLSPVSEAELGLVSPDGARPVWTDSDGDFAIALRPDEFPATLRSREGRLLTEVTQAPEAATLEVNINELAPRRALDDLFVAESASSSQAIAADEAAPARRCLFRVRGTTRLPEGSNVIVRLLGGGDKIVEETLYRYTGGNVIGEILCSPEGLYSGHYNLQLSWRTFSASPEQLAQVEASLPDPMPGEVPVRFHLPVYFGDREEEARQETEIRTFYEAALRECLLGRDLLSWLGSLVRGEESGYDAERIDTLKLHPAYAKLGPLGDARNFRLERWRQLIDQELPPRWRPYRRDDDVPYPQKYPTRWRNLQLAYEHLEKLMHLESRLVYRHLDIAPDPRDFVDFDFGVETEHVITGQRLDQFLRQLHRSMR